jgi:threonine synthase
MVSVQAAGCAPVVAAFEGHREKTEAWPNPHTAAYGLRVPAPLGGFLCLRALTECRGTAIAVPEEAIAPAAAELATRSGVDVCPEGGAAWAATRTLKQRGWISESDRVVVFNTGTGLKYR